VQIIFEYIGKSLHTAESLADITGKSLRTVKRALKELKDKNLIRRVGSDKSGSWEIIK